MARKKAQHLYEIFHKETKPAQPMQEQKPAPQIPLDPVSSASESSVRSIKEFGRKVENVVSVRRDTLIVAGILVLLLLVAAFFLGRSTSTPLRSRMEGIAPPREATHIMESETDSPVKPLMQDIVPKRESSATEIVVKTKNFVQCAYYKDLSTKQKAIAEAAAAFLREVGYPGATVEDVANRHTLVVYGFTDKSSAEEAAEKIRNLTYQGRAGFSTARARVTKEARKK